MINLYIFSLEENCRVGDREQTTSDSPDRNNSGRPVTGTLYDHNMVKHQRKTV